MGLQEGSALIVSLLLSFSVYVSRRGKFRLWVWKVESWALCSALRRGYLFSVKRRRQHKRDLGIGTDLGSSRICCLQSPGLCLSV